MSLLFTTVSYHLAQYPQNKLYTLQGPVHNEKVELRIQKFLL